MKPIYCSIEHEVLIEQYLKEILDGVTPLVNNEIQKLEFIDIVKAIIEYHNTYGEQYNTGNFFDFLTIIPLQLSMLTSGFLCGICNHENEISVMIQKQLVFDHTIKVVDDLRLLNINNE